MISAFLNYSATILLLACCSATIATGDEKRDPAQIEFETERAIVFKDGYCLIVKNGTATTNDDGVAFTNEVPDSAVLGSFWALPETGKIKSMIAGWVDQEQEDEIEVNCTNVIEVVKANVGNECSFRIGKDETVSGKILKVLEKDKPTVDDDPFALTEPISRVASLLSCQPVVTTNSTTGTHFAVRTESGDMMVAASAVSALTIKDMKSTLTETVSKKSRQKRITFDFGQANQEVKFRLIYFRPDVRWIPTYRVELTDNLFVEKNEKRKQQQPIDKKIAKLYLQGELLNDAEDLIDVPIHVVVGVPNFRFRDQPSPMTLEANLRSALSNVGDNALVNRGQQMSNVMFNQRRNDHQSNQSDENANDSGVSFMQQSGQGSNDLFVYELNKMSLKKGERAMVSIFNAEIAYRDVYTWDVKIKHNQWKTPTASNTGSPLELSKNRVWRQIELINNTDLPWTTGAAMMMDEFLPLGQELLTYTSPGGACRIPVTVAIDLKGTVKDIETGRKLKALEWNGRDYTRMDSKISISVENKKDETVPVEISVRFGGKATDTSDDGQVTLESYQSSDWEEGNYRNALNNSCVVKWKSTIEPGKSFKPTVEYEYLFHF